MKQENSPWITAIAQVIVLLIAAIAIPALIHAILILAEWGWELF